MGWTYQQMENKVYQCSILTIIFELPEMVFPIMFSIVLLENSPFNSKLKWAEIKDSLN